MIICNVPSKRYYLKYVKVVLREFNLPHFLVEDLGQPLGVLFEAFTCRTAMTLPRMVTGRQIRDLGKFDNVNLVHLVLYPVSWSIASKNLGS